MVLDYYYIYIQALKIQLVAAMCNYLTFFQKFSWNWEKTCKNSAISQKKKSRPQFCFKWLEIESKCTPP